FDLKLSGGSKPPMIVEVKSVTLVEGGVARFPDAPTARGRSHLDRLAKMTGEGYRCAVLFIALRSDAKRFEPNRKTDPEFAEALINAKSKGVLVKAIRLRVGRRIVSPMGEIPIKLSVRALA
ncbi:Sugar fermentation stimulation protein SfsA, partial [hydrothermal vent metagenome]